MDYPVGLKKFYGNIEDKNTHDVLKIKVDIPNGNDGHVHF